MPISFREGLAQAGFIEGGMFASRNGGQTELSALPTLAASLWQRAWWGDSGNWGCRLGARAQAASQTVPVVFTIGADPVQFGSWHASIGQAAM